MEGYGQAKGRVANCCRCYWNDQCCSGCGIEQEDCDDFTPLYDEDDYIEGDRNIDYDGDDGDVEYLHSFNDLINEAWLRGEDVSDKGWWR